MRKMELYNLIVAIQKSGGQGLSGLVKVVGKEPKVFTQLLDELIEDGLVKACKTGGSLGHRESNIFYMPTKGYNVWEDGEKGQYLYFTRLYLGALNEDPVPEGLSEEEDAKRQFLRPNHFDMIRKPEVMAVYTKWLERNNEELQILLNLEELDDPEKKLTDEERELLKSRGWFKDDLPIKECLKLSKVKEGTLDEYVQLTNSLIKLLEEEKGSYTDEIKKHKEKLAQKESQLKTRREINDWLKSQDENASVQQCYKEEAL